MPTLTWLHLSDVHLPPGTADTYQVDKVLKALIDTLKEQATRGERPDVIFFTGDIAEKGKDYAKAEKFFDDLLDATGLTEQLGKKARQRLFVVPGNHDVDQDKTKFLMRPLEKVEQANDFFAPQFVDNRRP